MPSPSLDPFFSFSLVPPLFILSVLIPGCASSAGRQCAQITWLAEGTVSETSAFYTSVSRDTRPARYSGNTFRGQIRLRRTHPSWRSFRYTLKAWRSPAFKELLSPSNEEKKKMQDSFSPVSPMTVLWNGCCAGLGCVAPLPPFTPSLPPGELQTQPWRGRWAAWSRASPEACRQKRRNCPSRPWLPFREPSLGLSNLKGKPNRTLLSKWSASEGPLSALAP